MMTRWVLGTCLCLAALAVALEAPLAATVAPDVPEISGSSVSAALGLLAAGILMLRSRPRR